MRFLHTADWHLGRTLHGRPREQEHEQFLNWLLETLSTHRVDALLVAGDIFDTRTPSNRAQELYYNFLASLRRTPCRHVVITSGNHDSPTFLDAPKTVLKALQVHVVGALPEESSRLLLTLADPDGKPEALVAAVPYLRDRDLRSAEPDETPEDRERKTVAGIRAHYQALATMAERKLADLPSRVPVLALGHLFAAGAATDGEDRSLYVGTLGAVTAEVFPPVFDYVALGHLHIPQTVGGQERIRYSGSPIPMTFKEAAGAAKEAVVIDFLPASPQPVITRLPIPSFQEILRLSGTVDELITQLSTLRAQNSRAWLEITCTEPVTDLRHHLAPALDKSEVTVLRLIDQTRLASLRVATDQEPERLAALTPEQVFLSLLEARDIPTQSRPGLWESFREILHHLESADPRAE